MSAPAVGAREAQRQVEELRAQVEQLRQQLERLLREHLERQALGVDQVVVFVDELNKYAPSDGASSISCGVAQPKAVMCSSDTIGSPS